MYIARPGERETGRNSKHDGKSCFLSAKTTHYIIPNRWAIIIYRVYGSKCGIGSQHQYRFGLIIKSLPLINLYF